MFFFKIKNIRAFFTSSNNLMRCKRFRGEVSSTFLRKIYFEADAIVCGGILEESAKEALEHYAQIK